MTRRSLSGVKKRRFVVVSPPPELATAKPYPVKISMLGPFEGPEWVVRMDVRGFMSEEASKEWARKLSDVMKRETRGTDKPPNT